MPLKIITLSLSPFLNIQFRKEITNNIRNLQNNHYCRIDDPSQRRCISVRFIFYHAPRTSNKDDIAKAGGFGHGIKEFSEIEGRKAMTLPAEYQALAKQKH